MKNYIATLRASQAAVAKPLPKFEFGGQAPAGAPAPAPGDAGAPAPTAGPQGAGDPMQAISALVQQFAQTQDPQTAIQIAQMLMQIMGGAQAPAAPQPQGGPVAGGMPQGPEGVPAGANGMKLRSFNIGGKVAIKK